MESPVIRRSYAPNRGPYDVWSYGPTYDYIRLKYPPYDAFNKLRGASKTSLDPRRILDSMPYVACAAQTRMPGLRVLSYNFKYCRHLRGSVSCLACIWMRYPMMADIASTGEYRPSKNLFCHQELCTKVFNRKASQNPEECAFLQNPA